MTLLLACRLLMALQSLFLSTVNMRRSSRIMREWNWLSIRPLARIEFERIESSLKGIPPFRVKAVLELLEHEDVTPDPSETYEGIDSGKIRKRPAFKMSQAGIPEGSVLEWAADPERTCTVITNNRVEYEGKEYPISELTATLKGWKNKYAPYPSQYWIFNGQTLHERRENLEAEEASEG